jgi:hypothetical protein
MANEGKGSGMPMEVEFPYEESNVFEGVKRPRIKLFDANFLKGEKIKLRCEE